jgi:hypothetical protein
MSWAHLGEPLFLELESSYSVGISLLWRNPRISNMNKIGPTVQELAGRTSIHADVQTAIQKMINHSISQSQSQSYSTIDGLPLIGYAPRRSWLQIFLQLNPCGHSPYVTSSLTRGYVMYEEVKSLNIVRVNRTTDSRLLFHFIFIKVEKFLVPCFLILHS